MKTTLTVLLIIQLYGLISCAIKQHYYINEKKTWYGALNHCRTFYYDLSTFTNEIEKQQFLQDAVSQTSDAWIGLHKRSGIWKWTTLSTQISWDVYYCGLLHKDSKKLYGYSRYNKLTFFCMNVSEIVMDQQSESLGGSLGESEIVMDQQSESWEEALGESEIVMVHQSESWEGALEYCRHHHDDLASLSSNRSMTDALSKITGDQTQYVWIGLRFLAGRWFWISGDDLIFKVWSSDEQLQCPAQNQRCAALDKNTQTWTPRDCEEKLNFLCFKWPEDNVSTA